MKPATPEAYQLLHDGAVALAEVECNGMRVDVGYIDTVLEQTKRRVKRLEEKIADSEVGKIWRRTFKGRTNWTSDPQLAKVLFDIMKFPAPRQTASGRDSTDEEALSTVDHPFVPIYTRFKKLTRAGGTFLKSIRREVVDGFIHCFFNLHTTRTYRSSSEDFNFQNLPIRDEEIAQIIRQCFIPRKDQHIVEIDFSGAEVKGSACYNKDPKLIAYITDKTTDMHRDMAMEIFKLPVEEISKPIRHGAKNQFVFPEFYGDWYKDCAVGLWRYVDKFNCQTASGKSLRQHLTQKGFKELGLCDPKKDAVRGTFEHHIQQVERAFWNDRFKVYSQWKKDWYEEYLRRGYFKTLTGFVCQGYMRKNEVINYPVQGSAFHLLLWSLIRLVKRELPKRGMKTLICGQIHDSIVADVPPGELDDFIVLCHDVMTEKVKRYAPWLIVPLEVESDVAPQGESWAAKKKYEVKR